MLNDFLFGMSAQTLKGHTTILAALPTIGSSTAIEHLSLNDVATESVARRLRCRRMQSAAH
jgi:hypothetical protein